MAAQITVYFNHGKESGPWGSKIKALAAVARDYGLAVESPDYQFTYDPDERLRYLIGTEPPSGQRLILVGSSMGGYVAAHASERLTPAGLFLMAPALAMPGYPKEPQANSDAIEVIHGWDDAIVPIANSWRFAATHRAALHCLDDGHDLRHQLDRISRLFDDFLARVLGKHS
jgi:predicted esterase